jgi:hypothetical protein
MGYHIFDSLFRWTLGSFPQSIILTDTEKQNWNDFCNRFESTEAIELFLCVLIDLKECRLLYPHPIQTIDGKEVDACVMTDIIEKFYNKPQEQETKTVVHTFVSLLKYYKTGSSSTFLEY